MNHPSRKPTALGLSLTLHLVVLVGLLATGSITSCRLDRPKAGTRGMIRDVGVAMVHRRPADAVAPPKPVDAAEEASDSSSNADSNEALADASPPASSTDPLDFDAALDDLLGTTAVQPAQIGVGDLTSLAQSLAGTGRGEAALVPGGPRLGGGAGRTTTSVFGVAGTGSTFVYVFDRSESMTARGSAPLRAAKAELVASLRTLTERQRFQIIFYNERATPYRPGGQSTGLIPGEPIKIQAAVGYVDSVIAVGGTEHIEPLRLAIRLSPDVIFFLSDAAIQTLGAAQIADLKQRCDGVGTVIHAIQFGLGTEPAGGSFLKPLARACGGEYRYVDTAGLR